ncbi:MAG: acyltransferase [Bacteroidales bacterium]|nr:acyltransferase [Bacteroidales bacterium]
MIDRFILKIQRLLVHYRYCRKFKEFGAKSSLVSPLRVFGPENIVIGNNVSIHHKCWLQAIPLTGGRCSLQIGDGTTIGDYNHIIATGNIIIENNVLTANGVYISDNLHEYEDINTPIKLQPIKQLKNVLIGEGCWIGEHVSIIGASIGRHSVIGANSVVTHDVPDYCVAVGIPAKVIKKYDFNLNQWIKV